MDHLDQFWRELLLTDVYSTSIKSTIRDRMKTTSHDAENRILNQLSDKSNRQEVIIFVWKYKTEILCTNHLENHTGDMPKEKRIVHGRKETNSKEEDFFLIR